uniref:RING-type domain-containing protein n=1 Tax=Stegastes partitus TaxID=144197 RepID=A0A3B5AE27_9TELE
MAEEDAPGGAAPPDDECKICCKHLDLELRRPKALGCSHTFCLKCLHTLYFREGGGWTVACPVCRQPTPVLTELTEALPLKEHPPVDPEERTGPSVSAESCCERCEHVAAFCACAIVSVLTHVVLLFLGRISVPVTSSSQRCRSACSVCSSSASWRCSRSSWP